MAGRRISRASRKRRQTRNGRTSSIFATTPRECWPNAGAMRSAAGVFSIALRDSVSDKIVATYKAGEPRPALHPDSDAEPTTARADEVRQIAPEMFAPMLGDPNAPNHKPPPLRPRHLRRQKPAPVAKAPPPPPPPPAPPVVAPSRARPYGSCEPDARDWTACLGVAEQLAQHGVEQAERATLAGLERTAGDQSGDRRRRGPGPACGERGVARPARPGMRGSAVDRNRA